MKMNIQAQEKGQLSNKTMINLRIKNKYCKKLLAHIIIII